MIRIAFVVYRNWAFDIYKDTLASLSNNLDGVCPLLITTPDHEFALPNSTAEHTVVVCPGNDQVMIAEALSRHSIDIVCFYGWSWMVREPVLSNYTCLCLHPSPLPKYRGGSPIQNQLVAGESMSAVSVIKMSEGIDDGDIYKQEPFSLEGDLNDILSRMIRGGSNITRQFITDAVSGTVVFTPQQNLELHPPLKRRTNADGEIKVDQAAALPYKTVYNLVRGLIAPYPNAYIVGSDSILYIEAVEYSSSLPDNAQIFSLETKVTTLDTTKPIALRVSDGYALLIKCRF